MGAGKNFPVCDSGKAKPFCGKIILDQGWPSGLGSELIIRLRQVQLLHPGFSPSYQILYRAGSRQIN